MIMSLYPYRTRRVYFQVLRISKDGDVQDPNKNIITVLGQEAVVLLLLLVPPARG